jgi:hypothetical protein
MLVAAGASTIAYKITKPDLAQQRVVPAELVDTMLTKHLMYGKKWPCPNRLEKAVS